ncbi:MAG: response regulator [Planctomycetes bacterium]|nr:response regulator [Planctomycetota bacterium]MBI3844849.1 response regulator [Planctomycetota bacterium]
MTDNRQVRQPLVLVVEDFQHTREMYVEYLKFAGFRVAEAANGLEAIDKATELLPDVILMDLALPRVDGWEATRHIKSVERTKRIPVVALTGHVLTGHAEGAKAVGCDAFVTKPCLPDALVVEIRRVINSRAKSASPKKARLRPVSQVRASATAKRARKHRVS